MTFFKWLKRKHRLAKRKKKLEERYTSDLTWREFSSAQLSKLNPLIDFDYVDNIYEIGWCNGHDKFVNKIKNLIQDNRLSRIADLNETIEEGQDEMGYVPIGDYLKTYIWTMKNGQSFIQLIKGSFDKKEEEIKFQQYIDRVDIKNIDKRKLIYPI
ncbi:MAG: hypothetical protein J7604_25595 [Sporocytophaga sp.]|uniref:hypothetical protein n=1 Tax=Sporocytophaga sp. TaxID=2231183 RepID=UPI001B133D71|nr:hypothetical protein [Sporocytophaga sp.]MBO9703604.1 hypothetical protein [Sporocytophaga sp.]